MFGAVRPPFISEDAFACCPFNYCDRCCDYCAHQQSCLVYKENLWDTMQAHTYATSYEQVVYLTGRYLVSSLSRLTEELDALNIRQEAGDMSNFSTSSSSVRTHIYESGVDLSISCAALLKRLEQVPDTTQLSELLRVRKMLEHYLLILPVKLWRAQDQAATDWSDARASAFVALRSLVTIGEAGAWVFRESDVLSARKRAERIIAAGVALSPVISEVYELEQEE